MLGSNAVMLNFFVKGLHETDSLTATVTSASVNFMLSVRVLLSRHQGSSASPFLRTQLSSCVLVMQAAGGYFLFGEHLPLQWFVGATLILVGMGCLLHGDSPPPATSAKAKLS